MAVPTMLTNVVLFIWPTGFNLHSISTHGTRSESYDIKTESYSTVSLQCIYMMCVCIVHPQYVVVDQLYTRSSILFFIRTLDMKTTKLSGFFKA